MKRRKGFLMIWVLASLTMVFILLGAVTFVLHTALSWEADREGALDEVLIAQDAVESEKYRLCFNEAAPSMASEVIRNGRYYHVEMKRELKMQDTVPMISIRCRVFLLGHEGCTLETWVENKGDAAYGGT